ncbi:hypothetical protein [Algihabitans sp.]|uniref:hypothetical protein n=1 Tax=Algihabitans sp. TaxID=2821514 RepID=UPI003BA93726
MTGPAPSKVRRVDYYPDEMISGVAGKLSPLDFGVYWMICTLIASRGGSIDNDPAWIAQLFKRGTRPRDIAAAITRLIAARKCLETDGKLRQPRMEVEVQRAAGRIQSARENGARGGRPAKQNKDLGKAPGSGEGTLTVNRQPATLNDSPASPVGEAAIPKVPEDRGALRTGPRAAGASSGQTRGSKTMAEGGRARDGSRGHRLPDDWSPSPQARLTAQEEGLTDDEIDRCADKFRDYWHAQPGAKGRKCDWQATWRNWVRREVDDGRVGRATLRRPGQGRGIIRRAGASPGDRAPSGTAYAARGGVEDRSFAAAVARAVQRQVAEPDDDDSSG